MTQCVLNYILPYSRKQIKLLKEHRYGHVPKSAEMSHNMVSILHNKKVKTDRIVPNKPDIIMHDN